MKVKFYKSYLSLFTAAHVFSFNVMGSDHEVLVSSPEHHGGGTLVKIDRGQYLLHDCGNSPGSTLDVTQFVNKIRDDMIAVGGAPRICFVSSHPQDDAFNLVKPIIEGLISIAPTIGNPSFEFILGGNSTDYQRTASGRELVGYLSNNLRIMPIYSNMNATGGINFVRQTSNFNANVSFLNPCEGGKYDKQLWGGRNYTHPKKTSFTDLNNLSLVTRIDLGGISVLLPGGAKTFERVAATASNFRFRLDADIAEASHHGGDGAIDEDPRYYTAVGPKYISFTVSPVERYKHPYKETFQEAYRCQSLTRGQNVHDIQYYDRKQKIWDVKHTKRNIFSTMDQGDLNFSWNNNNPNVVVAY